MMGSETYVSFTTATSKIALGANPRRVSLLIVAPLSNNFTLSCTNPATYKHGVQVKNTDPCLLLRVQDVGDWIQRELYGFCQDGPETITFIEGLLP